VSLTKGFEPESLRRMTEVIADVLPGHPAGVLTGPNLAREIVAGQAAAAVISLEDDHVARALQRLFRSGLFRVYINHDVTGCEVGGALKNVIAIATGMAQGLEAGDNTRSMIITRGLAELTRLGVAMGGRPETFAGLAGMGDLLATCMSPLSRNRHVGEQLGRGRALDEIMGEMREVAEGVTTSALVLELAGRYDLELPICESISAVVQGRSTPNDAFRGLLRRRPGHEAESD
jgi:glycerol-3-phosphate dehydrogenase (NAD(P)+)